MSANFLNARKLAAVALVILAGTAEVSAETSKVWQLGNVNWLGDFTFQQDILSGPKHFGNLKPSESPETLLPSYFGKSSIASSADTFNAFTRDELKSTTQKDFQGAGKFRAAWRSRHGIERIKSLALSAVGEKLFAFEFDF